ncbi:SDR family oxidoreductase [Streptomyces iranensis]|uniref:Beta-ketoacyl synthase n=1 Tax=Streptomyces iranensis TaxID=576784 RepID=A0A061A0Q4_9ACTN|nr:SDR family oxidoreductase [Streptomyces iranensis]MBP2060138.1 NAD(P)-dependent dehydrogenase (short-subunit alcohol dehydrogenase family)/3-oxoacyl-(acyl-carrier-protein) synthase [Streptomyces iranensis]CDR13855.1 Beta-ketoacyl synthase [Streptomyces iranensis]
MTSTENLRGRIALVTGAAKSLGADIVRRLAGSGAHVIVNYFHSVEQAKQLRAELEQAGHSCEFIRASVAKTSEIDRMFDLVQERHGGLDILINNAAGGAFLPLFDIDDTYWQRAWSTNVMAAYHCSRRAAELMAGRDGASILCLSSVGAHQPVPGYGPGGVTKAALESLVRYLALELVGQGIRVNTVLLGSVASEIVVNLDAPAATPGGPAEASELMSRTLSTPEAAKLIVHLLHEDAGFITGQTIVADGGISIGGMQGLRLHSRLADRVSRPARRQPVPAAAVTTTSAEASRPAPGQPAPASVTAPAQDRAPDPAPAPALDQAPETDPEAVAVVGLGLVLPGANNTAEFWDRLREGVLLSSEPSAFDLKHFWAPTREETDAFYVREAAYVHGFVPDPASIAEPDGNVGHPGWPRTTRWLRHCAVQALAGVHRRPADRWLATTTGIHDQTGLGPQGVVLGDEYRRMVREAIPAGQDGDWLAELADHAISAHYGGDGGDPKAYLPASVSRDALRGLIPDDSQHLTLDAACASGLFALDAAVKALREGSCDVALAGGTSVIEPIGFTLFCRAQGISMSGKIRPFDKAADGTLIGEGSIMLTLKSYARAVADGDRVLGVIRGTGLAADGRGKGIHAPATRGQELAIARAWADAGVEADDVDWVVAHGTGTPVGDEIELRSLLSRLGARKRACLLTSNKQVFGHTGVLAGLVSVAHALVALERGAVPGQPVVTDPHPLLEDGTRLTVPVRDAPWPTDGTRPRVVGVSSFGLGGADAHVVLSDRVPRAAPARRGGEAPADTERLVVVGWNTHLPGLDTAQVPAWLSGDGPPPEAGFGVPYPLPSPREVRIPPLTMRHMDPAHLMMLQALGPLLDQLGEPGVSLRPTTAVVVGATLPTTHNTRAALRVHAGECATTFDILPDPVQAQTLKEYLAKGMAEAKGVIPGDLNEDDFTGAVSCILSGRAANYYDFRGMGTSVYAHRDSAHTALDLALRQLRHRACDLALVGAVCQRPISGWDRHLDDLVPEGRSIAEGAAVLAVTRLSTAREHGLPVLGSLSTAVDTTDPGPPATPGHALPVLTDAGHTYLSLDALLAVLKAVATGADTVVTPAAAGSPPIRFTRPDGPNAHGPAQEEVDRAEPAQAADAEDFTGRRQTLRFVPTTPPRNGSATPSIPPGTIVITDAPDLAAAATGPDIAVWSPRPGLVAATHVPPEEAPGALAGLPFIPRHIRVLSRLPALDDGCVDGCDDGSDHGSDDAEAARMEDLQDLTFTTLQAALPALRAGGSLGALLLGAVPDDLPPPLSGLFTGLVRSVRAEVPQCGGVTLLSDAPDAASALDQLARAGTAQVPTHTLACRGGDWFTLAVADDHAPPPPAGAASLPPGAVVVAFGGARGITPELLHAIARTSDRPHVYVIGRTPLPETDDALPPQPEFIAAEHRRRPGASVGELRAAYEKAEARLEVRRTVRRLTELCGQDRVHHRVCDVLDAEATTAVLHEVVDRHGQIDLLINTVLDLRSRALHAKTLTDFRAVRATKATGYRNLKRALAGRPPRIWCNFSTLATLAPAPGDIDYCAVNEYLAYASAWAQRHGPVGHQELAILWSGWREVGVASSVTMRETLKRNQMDAYISTAQGCAQFLSAVTRPPAGGVAFFIREDERVLLARRGISTHGSRGISTHGSSGEPRIPAPEAPPPAPPDPSLTSPLLDGVLHRGKSWAVFTKTWDPHTLAERDGRWMRHHRVNGEYTLAGTFTLEAAAAAAAALCPGLVVTGFRGLICRTSITVRLAGPRRTVAVEARVTSRRRDGAEVAVRMTAHRIGKNGKVLRFNDLLCETTVVLADRYPVLAGPPDCSSHVPEPDFAMPVYSPDPPISLTGPFAGTSDYARGPDGNSARFGLDHAAWAPALAGMTVPAILLDAMVHLLLLPPRGDHPPLVGPMAGLDEVELGGPGNDCLLSAEHPAIRLHCDYATGDLTAVTGHGRVLARITGVTAHALDHSGELVRPRARVPQSPLS